MILLKEITDDKIIEKMLKSPCLWDRISEDGQKIEEFKLERRPEHLWIGIYNKTFNKIYTENLLGMFFLHPENKTTVQIHIHILKEYRELYATFAGLEAIKWFIDSDYMKMIAEIPVIYMDVYHYTKKFGFRDEGLNRSSFTKNGELHSQFRLGIKKSEAHYVISK